jgi:L-ribulose-5-phosphate 3-epimerase
MNLSRREWFGIAAGACAGGAASAAEKKVKISGIRFGVTDWNLQLAGKVEALAFAKSLGFEGIEVSLGQKPVNGKLPMDDAALQRQYLDAKKKTKMEISCANLDILHTAPLKSEKQSVKWVSDAIRIARNLGGRAVLMPMLGNNAPNGPKELDAFGDILVDLGREAEKAKVVLALESRLPAEDYFRIIERSKSSAVMVFFDPLNTPQQGPDAAQELAKLGKKHVAQMHMKDRGGAGYLGDGKVDLKALRKVIADIGYRGWIDLETASPSKSVENDMKKNLAYLKALLAS